MQNADKSKQYRKVNHTQVKVSVKPEIAAAFKAACASCKVSMASELSRFMAKRSGSLVERKTKEALNTRQKRRKAVGKLIEQLEEIREAEEQYKNNIPENLHNSPAYDTAIECISNLEDALESLGMTY